jgi:vanillate/3-O-methylgallate O-demethylase
MNGGKGGRRKVTLAWNGEDVARIQASMLQKGEHFKYIEMPLSNYANSNYDKLTAGGKTVGVSLFSGYSYNERSFLSLATVDEDVAIGNEVVLHWGEPNGGTRKTTVERHKQTEIRAIVSPVPYAVTARTAYADGWRTGKK